MKIKLSSKKESEFGSEIEISDQTNPEGRCADYCGQLACLQLLLRIRLHHGR